MHGRFVIEIIQGMGGPINVQLDRIGRFFEQNEWAKYVSEIFAIVTGAVIVRMIALFVLRRWARELQVKQKHLVELSERLLTPALAIGVVAAAVNLFPISDKLMRVLNRLFYVAILVLGIYCLTKVALILLDQWLDKDESRRSLREPTEFAVHVAFAAFGTMILLENLGISLTSVWTTLGVGSVAVALALQDTLSNFFAGVYLRIDRPVSLGDYIKLQSGEEGYVEERGWRSTRIKALSNHIIVIPNARLATTILTNFSLPNPRMSLSIPVSVNLNSDPQHVEEVLVDETAKLAGKFPGMPADAAPSAMLIPGFGPNSLDFTVSCTVENYVDQYSVQHELRKRIFRRLRAEKIEFPVPPRDVHVSMIQENRENHEDHADMSVPGRPKEMSRGGS
jgi:small-conductance mechanosensitive channel